MTNLNHIIDQLIEVANTTSMTLKIGIGITTQNRTETFKTCYDKIRKYSAGCKIVVVDDCSQTPVEEATYRFSNNAGIAKAKNKCLELLDDCDHIFLFDDDCWPTKDNWYMPYIYSREPHLMYIFQEFTNGPKLNDCKILYQDHEITAYSHARGCMLYFDKKCLKTVGGYCEVFGRWGWEHADLSRRIHNAGLTTFLYADVNISNQFIYSKDEHTANANSTVGGAERKKWIHQNEPLWMARRDSTAYEPYKETNAIITCYFGGVNDPQRSTIMDQTLKPLEPLLTSNTSQNFKIITNCASEFMDIHWAPYEYIYQDCNINPYFQRWISIFQYLQNSDLKSVFCVDATDVEVLKNPFPHLEPDTLYVGCENEIIGCDWMKKNHSSPEILKFIDLHHDKQLLNAGIVGGPVALVKDFVHKIIKTYMELQSEDENSNPVDMGIFNYVARIYFDKKLSYGTHVNTEFKKNERNKISWFKHK